MSKTSIEWSGHTWNPMVGCSKKSPGCLNCYAMGDSPHRFPATYERDGVVNLNTNRKHPGLTYLPRDDDGNSRGKGAQWTGEIRLLPWQLDVPLRRKKPTVWFVNSLSDLFHEAVVGCEEGRRFIAAIFGVMAATPQHTYQILTKRTDKAREWFEWIKEYTPRTTCAHHATRITGIKVSAGGVLWPLPNVWIGTSVEDQVAADDRVAEVILVPAAVHFLSCEPLLGPVDIEHLLGPHVEPFCSHEKPNTGCDHCISADGRTATRGIDWVIVGGESGAKARPCDVAWIRALVEQCKAAGVPCFVKQLGSKPIASGVPIALDGVGKRLHDSKGADMSQWPEDLRVRELPELDR